MSADNYLLIRKEGDVFVGYHQFVSSDEPNYDHRWFTADSLVEAILTAQLAEMWTEYGYRFVGLEEYLEE